ncbi:Ultraviolet-B receptor UVR8 [Geodia barretti]|uniref:Ultraviolet-B receptor UVR8 n=1 Tax=Geodia barretti TaxID=519541 RepID=A0AA35XIY3_GEOBA|nr:Ultraviolet-B receptor UVR8 [Geodia barretti]
MSMLQVGEITFFDLKTKTVALSVLVSGCIDAVYLACLTDSTTYLLMGLRGGEWKRMLLEEHYHEAPDVSYADVTANDFEVVPDDVVIKSCLDQDELVDPFDLKNFSIFCQLTHLRTQDWRRQHLLTSLNLTTGKLEAYSYNFDLRLEPLNAYQLISGATDALLTDRLIYAVSHIDVVDPCSFTLSLVSTQKALVTELHDQSQGIIQQFTLPSSPDLVGFYSTEGGGIGLPTDGSLPVTHLGGCIIVTKTSVYQCRQIYCPDSIFLDMALSLKEQEKAEDFGITLKLDICGLYKVAAERVLEQRNFSQALKLFELSHCRPQHIIQSFARIKKVPELVKYLHQAVYDDTGHAALGNTKQAQDILFQCFLHECLRLCGTPDGCMMLDKFSQFITDKFLYDQSVAMEGLLDCGLKEQLFELAKAHNKLQEVLDTMVKRGCIDLSPSVQASLASRQYISTVSEAADGHYLYQMMPSTFVRFLITMPVIIPQYLNHILTLLPNMNVSALIRLANLFDPSHSTIQPLLIKAHTSRPRSHSTGSLVSVADSLSSGIGAVDDTNAPKLDEYIEVFLTILIILNVQRGRNPATRRRGIFPVNSDKGENELYSEASQWTQGRVLACGLNHAALLVNGDLYTWGATKNGKLGHGDIEEEQRSIPLRVETFLMLNVHVLSVTCGAEHTIALCQEGVYSWGSSSHGQLGHGDTLKRSRPVQISTLADKGIIAVECGQYHSLALSDDHSVWSWGWGVHGQLGLQSVDEKLLPTHATLLDERNVSVISAGYGHSAVLTVDGKVLTFGNGMYGQLGHGNTEKQSAPKLVTALQGQAVYLLACGNFHTIAVTNDQQVYFWGKNLYRTRPSATSIQGLKEYKRTRQAQSASPPATATNTHTPLPLLNQQLGDSIVQISCGSFHSLLLTADGGVYSWGSNVHGQLGHPQVPEMQNPSKVGQFDNRKIVAVGAGDEFSLAVDESFQPWGWGRAEHGQLGFESRISRGGAEAP